MPRAILKNGVIVPVEPLPPEWGEGTEVEMEAVLPEAPDDIDRWYNDLEALCAQGDPEDDVRLQKALDQIRQEGKEIMRRKMGL